MLLGSFVCLPMVCVSEVVGIWTQKFQANVGYCCLALRTDATSARRSAPGALLFWSLGSIPRRPTTEVCPRRCAATAFSHPGYIRKSTHRSLLVFIPSCNLFWFNYVSTVIMREMAPIGEMAPGYGKRSKKEILRVFNCIFAPPSERWHRVRSQRCQSKSECYRTGPTR